MLTAWSRLPSPAKSGNVTDRLEVQFIGPRKEMLTDHQALQSNLLEFRQMLESQAASLAADRTTDADSERIDAAYSALNATFGNDALQICIDIDVAFHHAISEAAHNVLIGHLPASLMILIQRHISSNLENLHTRPRRRAQIRAQHSAMRRLGEPAA